MRNRARWAMAAAAMSVTTPLIGVAAAPADAATLPDCPPTTGNRVINTPATYPKTVALTFDDGPNPIWTPQVLAVLARHHVHATFFVVGERAEANPDVLQHIVDAGHAVGNHTWDHPTVDPGMYALSARELVTEFDPTNALIKDSTNRPVCFFRAPQGKDNTPTIRKLAKERGLTVTGYHSASDYLQPDELDPRWVAQIAHRLEDRGPHPILLLHDGGRFRGNSVRALDTVITWYARRGYVFTDPAGRPFPGDLGAGANLSATGWAVPPDWIPPTDDVTGTQPTGLPSFASAGGDPAATGTASPSTSTTTGTTTEPVPGGMTGAGVPPSNPMPGDPTAAAKYRLTRLATNGAKDPLAARKLTDDVARYLMIFAAPPA
jgi:peptidoglycan/xylan/chitin deacetylase (PgdA/CDA1 family)